MVLREIVVGLEVVGSNPEEGGKIIEIYFMELLNKEPTGRCFHSFFNPGQELTAYQIKSLGESIGFIEDMPLFSERCDALLDFIGKKTPLIGHGINWMLEFLNAELAHLDKATLARTPTIDTIDLFQERTGEKISLLTKCLAYFGVKEFEDERNWYNKSSSLPEFVCRNAELYKSLNR